MDVIVTNLIIFLVLVFLITWLFIALVVYFMPTVVAVVRKHKNIYAIAILNTVLGWTFLGWLASLLWSLNSDTQEQE